MNPYFEIAYAAATNRLCLFTGTGFSKAVSNNQAPSWQELLVKACDSLPNATSIKDALFPPSGKNPLTLEESAQVISLELGKIDKNIHEEIATQISSLQLSGDNNVISEFLQARPIRVVTTNYDRLVEELVGEDLCQSITPGFPIPRASAHAKIYHVHGSIDSPPNMVITSDDYFRFMNGESYFSRKLSTVLHENTIVILGYSLADTNLKTIISDYKAFSKTHFIGGNLFLVARSKVDNSVKDYYSHCYGIRVLDQLGVHDFFTQVNTQMVAASKCALGSIDSIKKVFLGSHFYADDYLKLESSFYEITASVAAIGRSINDKKIVSTLDQILVKKMEFTRITGAWEQYTHLARWLCHLATILELQGTSIEKTFLDAVFRSMETMSKHGVYGYSWHAYTAWNSRWEDILTPNRHLIRKYIESKSTDDDALGIVARG